MTETGGGEARIDALVASLATREPGEWDVGTPVLDFDAPEIQELVRLGPTAVPGLLARAQAAPARPAAWIVMAIGLIGDRAALPGLRNLLASYQARPKKQTWDFAVMSEADAAIARLESTGRK